MQGCRVNGPLIDGLITTELFVLSTTPLFLRISKIGGLFHLTMCSYIGEEDLLFSTRDSGDGHSFIGTPVAAIHHFRLEVDLSILGSMISADMGI
jgi:hypothetical protein